MLGRSFPPGDTSPPGVFAFFSPRQRAIAEMRSAQTHSSQNLTHQTDLLATGKQQTTIRLRFVVMRQKDGRNGCACRIELVFNLGNSMNRPAYVSTSRWNISRIGILKHNRFCIIHEKRESLCNGILGWDAVL